MEHSFELSRHRRSLFGEVVDEYRSGRPAYPEAVYALLRDHCGLGPNSDVLEIGPGTGQATRALLDHGASVTAVELSGPMADRLRADHDRRTLTVVTGAFEDVELPATSFDLVAAATAFHWVAPDRALVRAHEVLRSTGWLALWWTYFGDPARPDPFHDALVPVLTRLAPELLDIQSAGAPTLERHPYALDVASRTAEIDASGRFGSVQHHLVPWTGRHPAAELRALFASFSPWIALDAARRAVALDALEQLAFDEFNGVVERPYLTSVFLAPCAPAGREIAT